MLMTPEVLQHKGQRIRHELKIQEIREKHGNAAASSADLTFGAPYFGRFPIDTDCIGTICNPSLWEKVKMPENMPHPTINPVWDFEMPESCQGMGWHYHEWLFMLIKVESNQGWPAGKNEYTVIYSPIEELYTLETDNKGIFVEGEKVGFVKYPQSRDYDLWMLLNPNQESLDEIEIYYQDNEE